MRVVPSILSSVSLFISSLIVTRYLQSHQASCSHSTSCLCYQEGTSFPEVTCSSMPRAMSYGYPYLWKSYGRKWGGRESCQCGRKGGEWLLNRKINNICNIVIQDNELQSFIMLINEEVTAISYTECYGLNCALSIHILKS